MLHQNQIRTLQNSIRGSAHSSPDDRPRLTNQPFSRSPQQVSKSGSSDQASLVDRGEPPLLSRATSRDRGGNSINRATPLRVYISSGGLPTFERVTDTVSKRDVDYFKYEVPNSSTYKVDARFIVENYSPSRMSLQILDQNGKIVGSFFDDKASTTIRPFSSNGFVLTLSTYSFSDRTYYIRVATGSQKKANYTLKYDTRSFTP